MDEQKNLTRKKILILALLLLCVGALVVLIVFRACIPFVDFWTVAGSVDVIDTKIENIQKIEGVSGTRASSKGSLSLYESIDAEGKRTQTLVHLLRGEIVAALADTEELLHTVTLYETGGVPWYSVVTVTESANEKTATDYGFYQKKIY